MLSLLLRKNLAQAICSSSCSLLGCAGEVKLSADLCQLAAHVVAPGLGLAQLLLLLCQLATLVPDLAAEEALSTGGVGDCFSGLCLVWSSCQEFEAGHGGDHNL